MINRRDFVKQSATLAFGGIMLNPWTDLTEMAKKRKYGVQLFTLFPTLEQDLKGNLQKIAAIGYKEIESAFSTKGGYYGMKSKEFAAFSKELGLSWQSHHVLGAPFKPRPDMDLSKMPKMPPMLTLKDNTQQVVDEVAEGGVKYLVCASIPTGSLDEIKESVEILSKAGEKAKKAGLTLCYHNHDAEFNTVEGQIPYDIFLSQISPDLMKMELDLAWVSKAGVDPVGLFKKYPKRFPLLHVKDMSSDFKTIMPVGEGSIDFKRIFAEAKLAGVKHFFVEHDMPKNAFESLSSSFKYLNGLNK